MMNFEDLFVTFFDEEKISLTKLSNYAHTSLDRMIELNPGTVLAARITATQVALAAMEAKTTDSGVKMGIQKGKTLNKKTFRKALPEHMAKIHAAVVLQYGKNAAELLEIFPKGLTVFGSCRDEQLENEMQVTLAGLTAHQADLGATVLSDMAGLLSTWISTYGLQAGAKVAQKASGGSLQTLRTALELELQKNVLFVAFTFPLDRAKGMFYLPQELLRSPKAAPGVPGAAVIQQVAVDGATRSVTVRVQSAGAQTVELKRRGEFELEATVVAAAIAVLNGVCVFMDTVPADGLWNYQATPSNAGGAGPASPELGVQVN